MLETDITKLTMPDTMLHRQILSSTGNPSKVFMSLELGVVPVRYVLMAKRLNMLHYILNESTSSTMYQVYEELKRDSRKGDFYSLIKKDFKDLDIQINEESIKNYSKNQCKVFIKNVVKESAFQNLVPENSLLEKTRDICFKELKTSDYLLDNRNTTLSKVIFSLRSKTLDIKTWQPWKYFDNLCVLCELKEETISHFLNCNVGGYKGRLCGKTIRNCKDSKRQITKKKETY